jgi:hypothetical protein
LNSFGALSPPNTSLITTPEPNAAKAAVFRKSLLFCIIFVFKLEATSYGATGYKSFAE